MKKITKLSLIVLAAMVAQSRAQAALSIVDLAPDGSNLQTGNIEAFNFYDPSQSAAAASPTINGVAFTGETVSATNADYTLTFNGNFDGLDTGTPPGVMTTDAIYPLVYADIYSGYAPGTPTATQTTFDLTLNGLTPGHSYSLEAIFDETSSRSAIVSDGADSTTVSSATGPEAVLDTFTESATGTSEELVINQSNYGDGLGGYVLADTTAIPEPSTWAMMLAGLVGLVGFRARRRA